MILKNLVQFQVYDHLKENILTGKLQNNTLYSETKLAVELGISRTPIREALHCLSQDGYINIIPSKGFIIRPLNEDDMHETIQIRCAIEGFCTHNIASEVESEKGQKLLNNLSRLLMLQESSAKPNISLKDFMEYDHEFHLALVDYVDNKEFNQIYQRSMYQIHLTTTTALSFPRRTEDTLNEHKLFFSYLKTGDGDSAYHVLIDHLMMPLNMHILSNPVETKFQIK